MSDIHGRIREVRDVANAAANGSRTKQMAVKDVADLMDAALEAPDDQWKKTTDALARDHGVTSIVYARITADEWAMLNEVEAIRAGRIAHG